MRMSAFGTKRTYRGKLVCPLSGVKRTSLPHDSASAFDPPDGRSFEGRNRMNDLLACQSVSAYPETKSASAKQCVTRDGNDPNASAFDRGPCRRGRCGTAVQHRSLDPSRHR